MDSYAQGDIVALPRFVYFDVPEHKSKRLSFVEQEPEAIVLLTQTCDVARSSHERPFVQVAPLVRVLDADIARRCRGGAHPQYAWVPASGADGFADLDRVATITKRLLATCNHSHGLRDDDERREFARAIVRKLERFAFPDDLRDSLEPLRARILEKNGKPNSPEGALLREVRQIRAHADPDWATAVVSVQLVFILDAGALTTFDNPPQPAETTKSWFHSSKRLPNELAGRIRSSDDAAEVAWLWGKLVDAWAEMCEPCGVIADVVGEVVCADEYTLDRYWAGSALDLDYLSPA
jgi:hypothetical protein